MAEVIRLDGATQSDAVQRYSAALASTLVHQNVEVRDVGGFHASILLEQINGMRLAVIGSYPQVIWRDDEIAFAGDGQLHVHLQMAGRCIMTQGRNTVALRRGDIAVYDSDRTFNLRFEAEFTVALFVVPRSALTVVPEDLERIAATNLNNRSEFSRAAAPFLRDIAEQAVRMGGIHEAKLADYASAMLVDLINDAVGNTSESEAPLATAARFIRSHCDNQELSAAEIARSAGLTTRALHKLFQNNGTTVAKYIHLQRLGRVRTLLAERPNDPIDVETIAQKVGYPDVESLERIFKNNTGMTTTEWRGRNGS